MPPSFGLNSGIAADLFQPVPEKHSFSANRAAEPQTSCACQPLPYTSVEDLVRRVPLINKREIRALSMAGALNFDNTVHRREALWRSELAIKPPGDLFDGIGSPPVSSSHVSKGSMQDHDRATDTETPFLKRLEGLDLVEADLKKTGISIGKHPMTFIRDEMNKRGVLTAVQTRQARVGDIVSAAGAAIIRQRPMTAKNVVFITLEDETGHSNFVVMPDTFERFRDVITQNNFLLIKGRSEDGGVIKALYFEPIYRMNAEVVSHDFR
jgi:error-prone DNA polymerase